MVKVLRLHPSSSLVATEFVSRRWFEKETRSVLLLDGYPERVNFTDLIDRVWYTPDKKISRGKFLWIPKTGITRGLRSVGYDRDTTVLGNRWWKRMWDYD